MKTEQPDLIVPGLWRLGRKESSVYLLQGSHDTILISGGNSYILPDVLAQIDSLGFDIAQIHKFLILHAHFDHVGILPYFKRKNPKMTVYGSKRAWEILKMDKAVATMNEYSWLTTQRMGLEKRLEDYDWKWRHDVQGETVKDGDAIDLGGRTVKILETPGHSSCSVAAYVPEIKGLFPSDGGGIPNGDKIAPAGNSNFTLYQQSLKKLVDLEVEILCADHYGYFTGEKAADYIHRSIQAADKYRHVVEEICRQEGNQEDAVRRLVQISLKERPDNFLPEEIMTGVTRQVVKHIAGQL